MKHHRIRFTEEATKIGGSADLDLGRRRIYALNILACIALLAGALALGACGDDTTLNGDGDENAQGDGTNGGGDGNNSDDTTDDTNGGVRNTSGNSRSNGDSADTKDPEDNVTEAREDNPTNGSTNPPKDSDPQCGGAPAPPDCPEAIPVQDENGCVITYSCQDTPLPCPALALPVDLCAPGVDPVIVYDEKSGCGIGFECPTINPPPSCPPGPMPPRCADGSTAKSMTDDHGCTIGYECPEPVCPTLPIEKPICPLGTIPAETVNADGCVIGYSCVQPTCPIFPFVELNCGPGIKPIAIVSDDGCIIDHVCPDPKDTCTDNKQCASDSFCNYADKCAQQTGSCTFKPTNCAQIYDPVCGCDGRTYSNSCAAMARGISIAHPGPCATTL